MPPRGRLGLDTMREAQCCGHGVVLQKGVGQGSLTAAATGTRIVGAVGKGPTPSLATAQGKETVLSCSCPALAVLQEPSQLCVPLLYMSCAQRKTWIERRHRPVRGFGSVSHWKYELDLTYSQEARQGCVRGSLAFQHVFTLTNGLAVEWEKLQLL